MTIGQQGIGSRLSSALCRDLRARGRRGPRFDVEDPNDAATDPHEADERRRRVVAAVKAASVRRQCLDRAIQGTARTGGEVARPGGFPVAHLGDAPDYWGDITKRLDR
jgi:hypothetical protein